MKIVVHGPAAGYGPDGNIHSWAPDQEVAVDDSDDKAVAWARSRVETGLAHVVDDVRETPKEVSDGAAESRRARQRANRPEPGAE